MSAAAPPSDWLLRWAHLIAPGGEVLDLACGSGRHLRWLQAHGHRVTGVDRDAAALASFRPLTDVGAELMVADLEGADWPLAGRTFDAVLVTNYLWRPRLPDTLAAVAPDGVLLYETYAQGQETVGRPARAEFLLAPGELLQAAAGAGLRVVAYEDGFDEEEAPEPRFVQRIAAVRPPGNPPGTPQRWPLGRAGRSQ